MLENNFEKNVEHQLEVFKVKPSDEVWQKVEERIREKKKRRIFFIIVLFGGLALLGYWQRSFFIPENKLAETTAPIAVTKTGAENNISNPPELSNNTDKRELNEKKSNIVLPKPNSSVEKRDKENLKKQAEKNSIAADKYISAKNKISKPFFVKSSKEKKEGEKEQIENNMSADIAAVEKTVMEPDSQKTTPSFKHEKEKMQVTIAEEKKPEERNLSGDTAIAVQSLQDSALVKKPVIVNSRKWKLGFQFTPGISNEVNKVFSSNKSADAYSAPQGGGSTIPIAGPSPVSAAFAFNAGLFAQTGITNKMQLSVGLQYSYYSSRILVGASVDSVLNSSNLSSRLDNASRANSASNARENVTNKFHFIELPVSLLIRLNKNAANPVYYSIGFTAGQKIGSRALVYDTAFRGIYIDNKKAITKTQFSISTGFSFGLHGKNLRGDIGPFITLHVSPLLNSSLQDKSYLYMAGLKSRFFFAVKK